MSKAAAPAPDVRDIVALWLLVSVIVILLVGWLVAGNSLFEFLASLAESPDRFIAHPLFKVIVFPGLLYISILAMALIYFERKLAAKVQIRVGPQYAGRIEGIMQVMADALKMITKEFIIPRTVDVPVFVLAPIISFVVGALAITVVPFSETTIIFPFEANLLLFFAITGFFPLTVLLAGWSSNNKFSFIGGVRGLFQQISYEIPLLISALAPAILAGSLRIEDIVAAQEKIPFFFIAPISAIIFLAAALAETEKHPFEIPEAESEIVMGWMTEYSSMGYALFMFAVYAKIIALSTLYADLFMAGWIGPPILPPEAWTVIKSGAIMFIFLIVRALFPRLRIDQLLRMGWGSMIALSILGLFLALVVNEVIS